MAKTKKLTFAMLYADMPERKEVEIEYTGRHKTYILGVKETLSFDEAMMFVRDIAKACVGATGISYRPEAFDFAVKAATLSYYAGLEIGEDVGKIYDVIYGTDLYNLVREQIDEAQYLALVNAARDTVNYERDSIVSAQGSQMNALLAKMDEVMRSGSELAEQLSGDEMKKNLDELMRLSGMMNGSKDNVVELPFGDKR